MSIAKKTSDDIPRIAGLLNNCAMYCALPILLENIHKLAELEKNSALSDDATDAVYHAYVTLKNLFFFSYGINEAELMTWERFSNFLLIHSFYASEIIFSPVFRQYIAGEACKNTNQAWDLSRLRDIQPERLVLSGYDCGDNPDGGRYNCLAIHEVDQLFFQKLGISVILFEFDEQSETYIQQYQKQYDGSDWQDPVLSVTMFLKDKHYELQPHEQREGACADQFVAEINQLNPTLANIHYIFSTSQSASQSNYGLSQLVLYVRQAFLYDSSKYPFTTAHHYATTKEHFHNDTLSGRMTFAAILLTLAFEEQDQTQVSLFLQACDKRTPYTKYLVELIIKIVKMDQLELLKVQDPGIRLLRSACNNEESLSDETAIEPPHSDLLDKLEPNLCLNILLKTIEHYPASVRNNSAPVLDVRHIKHHHLPALVAHFQLKFLIALAAAGAALLFLAFILVLPPAAAGACVIASKVMASVGGASLLASAGLFAYQNDYFSECESVVRRFGLPLGVGV